MPPVARSSPPRRHLPQATAAGDGRAAASLTASMPPPRSGGRTPLRTAPRCAARRARSSPPSPKPALPGSPQPGEADISALRTGDSLALRLQRESSVMQPSPYRLGPSCFVGGWSRLPGSSSAAGQCGGRAMPAGNRVFASPYARASCSMVSPTTSSREAPSRCVCTRRALPRYAPEREAPARFAPRRSVPGNSSSRIGSFQDAPSEGGRLRESPQLGWHLRDAPLRACLSGIRPG